MEESKRFRNHISIVFEQVGSGFYVLLGFFLWQIIGDEEMMTDIASLGRHRGGMLLAAGVILGLLVLIFGVQILIWSKTYISVDRNTIVVEKNTLKKQRQTIGIRSISNVNTEQNLFEMLVGTCKIKMDTNSLSTADSTDVKIVLKKQEAEAFKNYILALMNQKDGEEMSASMPAEPVERADIRKMLLHGLFSIRITSVIVALLGFFGFVGITVDALSEGMAGLLAFLSELLVLGIVALSGLWSIVKGFLRYYGFSATRKGDKLYIHYGFIKKVNYTIPVDKINAIRFIQSPHARLAGWYTAELLNVGMGDEEDKEQSFFLMYDKRERIAREMQRLLPEFAGYLEERFDRQPFSVWKVWVLPEILFVDVLAILYGAAAEFVPEALGWVLAGLVALAICVVVSLIMRYLTGGSCIKEDVLGICQGAFGRTKIFIKYDKIQYVEVKQNFLAKTCGIAKAEVYLLASMANQTQSVPYFKASQAEVIKEKILKM